MINSKEYIALLTACHEVLPLIKQTDKILYENLDLMRKQWYIIKKEFSGFALYPHSNTDKLHEAIELMVEYCHKTDVKVFWAVPPETVFSLKNWSSIRKNEQLAFFHFEDVNITKLLDF